jgi:hypothetical protein
VPEKGDEFVELVGRIAVTTELLHIGGIWEKVGFMGAFTVTELIAEALIGAPLISNPLAETV